MTKEPALTKAILEAIGSRSDVLIWRANVAGNAMVSHPDGWHRMRFGLPGCADLIGCWKGRFLAIEVKATGNLSFLQKGFRDRVIELGGVWILARSVDDVTRVMGPSPHEDNDF